jgi:hypothetical protein
MKKLEVLFFLLIIAANSYSQEFRVKSMLELTHDLSARTSPRIDKTGMECALIRVNIPTIKDVYFQSPIVGDPIQAPGEYTVYVPTNTERLQMICDNKQVDVVFADYSISLQPKLSYRVVVTRDSRPNEATGFAKVTVMANYDDDILLIDGIPAGQLPLIVDDLPIGEHTFAVPNTNGRTCNDTVITVTPEKNRVFLSLRQEKRHFVPLEINIYDGMEGQLDIGIKNVWDAKKVVERNGKKGIVGDDGSIIVPVEYDDFEEYSDDIYLVYKKFDCNGQESWESGYYIPGKGEVVPCDCNVDYSDKGDKLYVMYEKRSGCPKELDRGNRGRWANLFDFNKKMFVLPEHFYSDIEVYDNKLISALDKNWNIAIMDMSGICLLTIPGNYGIDFFGVDPVGALVVRGNMVYGLSGQVYQVPSHYKVLSISEGLLCVQDVNTGLVGYINKEMEVVIPVKYEKDYSYGFSHKITRMRTKDRGYVYYDNKGRQLLQIDYSGNVISQSRPTPYKMIKTHDNYGSAQHPISLRFYCENNSGEHGIVDAYGHIIVPFTRGDISFETYGYGERYYEEYNYYKIEETDGYVTLLDYMGNTILQRTKIAKNGDCFVAAYSEDKSSPLRVVALSNTHLLIYNGGRCEVRIPVSSDAEIIGAYPISIKTGNNIISRIDDSLFLVKNLLTNKTGYLSTTGELLASCIYDEPAELYGVNCDFMDNLYDSIDWSYGDSISHWQAREQHILSIDEDLASEGYGVVGIGGRYGYINTSGKVVVPLMYTAVSPFHNGVAYLREESGKWTKIYAKDLK